MSEPALKCAYNASFKQIYTLKLFIVFKTAYSCCFSLGGNLDFPEFLQKKFNNINYCCEHYYWGLSLNILLTNNF